MNLNLHTKLNTNQILNIFFSFHFSLNLELTDFMLTEEEQNQLPSILAKLLPEEFEILKTHFSNKTTKKQGLNRSSFTQEEDTQLKALVQQYGDNNWAIVASHMDNRTTRQCRERYRHYLSPSIINGEWTEEEDKLLIAKYSEYGPRWVSIAQFFKTRTDINIKNRWIVLMRRNATKQAALSTVPITETKQRSRKKKQNGTEHKHAILIKPLPKIDENTSNTVEDMNQFFDEFENLPEWNIDNSLELI